MYIYINGEDKTGGDEWASALEELEYNLFSHFLLSSLSTRMCACAHVCVYVCIYRYTYAHPFHCVLHYISLKKYRESQCQETRRSRARTTNYPYFSYQNTVSYFSSKTNSFWFPLKQKWMVIYNFFFFSYWTQSSSLLGLIWFQLFFRMNIVCFLCPQIWIKLSLFWFDKGQFSLNLRTVL